MTDDDRRRDEDEEEDRFPGKRRRGHFDPFWGSDIDEEFERMRRYMDKMMESAMSGDLFEKRGNKPFIYGFSMRTGPDGKPRFQEFGNTRNVRRMPHGRQGPGIERTGSQEDERETIGGREPLTDVIDCGETIAVTVELPGVEKSDIELDATEDVLTISVDTPDRRYFKEVDLPARVKSDTAKASYRHGVLDVTLEKTSPKKSRGTRIEIE